MFQRVKQVNRLTRAKLIYSYVNCITLTSYWKKQESEDKSSFLSSGQNA